MKLFISCFAASLLLLLSPTNAHAQKQSLQKEKRLAIGKIDTDRGEWKTFYNLGGRNVLKFEEKYKPNGFGGYYRRFYATNVSSKKYKLSGYYYRNGRKKEFETCIAPGQTKGARDVFAFDINGETLEKTKVSSLTLYAEIKDCW